MLSEACSAQTGDWRRAYTHVLELSAFGCAWEFVRRNPKISNAWSALKPAWKEVQGDHDLKIIEARNDFSLPYLWASSPGADATAASVVWNPAATSCVLDVVALPPKVSFGGQVLDLEFLAAEKILFIGSNGIQQLLLRSGTHSFQLNISGECITAPATLYVDTAVSEDRAETQTRLLECFRKLRATGTLPAECFPAHPYAKRAAIVLMALDGHLAGVAHREIAVAMFGEERVARDWSDPGEHLRDAVRRAIARGIILMNGGYQIFLR